MSAGGLNLAEVNIEAVGEHQRFARGHVRRDFGAIQIALNMVGHQDHAGVGRFGGLGDAYSTLRPAASALATLLLPAGRPTMTLTPLSRRLSACACPWLP